MVILPYFKVRRIGGRQIGASAFASQDLQKVELRPLKRRSAATTAGADAIALSHCVLPELLLG